MKAEEAIAISKLVLVTADQDTDNFGTAKNKGKNAQVGDTSAVCDAEGVDFPEFLIAREGGQMIGWNKYVALVTKTARSMPKEESAETIEEWTRLFNSKVPSTYTSKHMIRPVR